jgi:hypothetical protein
MYTPFQNIAKNVIELLRAFENTFLGVILGGESEFGVILKHQKPHLFHQYFVTILIPNSRN